MRSFEFTQEQVLAAIKGSMGIVSKIAHALDGCDWHTAQRYVNRWAETRAAYADESERALDLSESQLLKAVQAGDGPMIRFHLATKGKQRGYVVKTETEQSGDVVIRVKYDGDSAAPSQPAPGPEAGQG